MSTLTSNPIADEVIETIRASCAAAKDDPTEFFLSVRIICEDLQARRAGFETSELQDLRDDLTVARDFIRRCVEAVGRDPKVSTVDLLELADQVVGTIEQYKVEAAGAAQKASEPQTHPDAGGFCKL